MVEKTQRLCLVLGDQLSFDLPSLTALEQQRGTVLMVEVMEEATYVPHHPQKIILIFSAMRHFAQALRDRGWRVQYVTLDDPQNTGSVPGELQRWHTLLQADEVHVTECGDWRLEASIKASGLDVKWHADTRFLFRRPRESYQFSAGLLDFFIHLCKIPFSGLLLFVHKELAFKETDGIVDFQDLTTGLGVHKVQASFIKGVVLLVLATPVHQIILYQIEMRKVVVNERLHQLEGVL